MKKSSAVCIIWVDQKVQFECECVFFHTEKEQKYAIALQSAVVLKCALRLHSNEKSFMCECVFLFINIFVNYYYCYLAVKFIGASC